MFKEIVIIGGSKTGVQIAKNLLKHGHKIIIITRNKDKFKKESNLGKGITIKNYQDSIQEGLPCIITVSCDEVKIVQNLIAQGEKNISRLSVLENNIKIINNIIPYLNQSKFSHFFVLTNPPEFILYYLSHKLKKNGNLFGLGLNLDSQRYKYALKMGFGIDIQNLYCIGNHTFKAIPIIEKYGIFKKNISFDDIIVNIKKFKNYRYAKNKNIDYLNEFIIDVNKNFQINKESIYQILDILVSLLVRSEFSEGKPPIQNPCESVSKTINLISKEKLINISYVRNGNIKGGKIKINSDGGYREIIDKNISEIEKNLSKQSNNLLKKYLF